MQGMVLFGVLVFGAGLVMALFAWHILRKGPQVSADAAEATARYRAYFEARDLGQTQADFDQKRPRRWRRIAWILGACVLIVAIARAFGAG